MESELRAVLAAYADLEMRVRAMSTECYGEVCALCTSTCCTPDICEESVDSAFLRALRSTYENGALFCDRFGWLTEKGCALGVGRPPVCYRFFCDEIMDSLGDRERRIILVLGRLMVWVGERASGSRHLVEVMDDEGLKAIRADRVIKRIEIAREALAGIESMLGDAPVSAESAQAMQAILKSAELDA